MLHRAETWKGGPINLSRWVNKGGRVHNQVELRLSCLPNFQGVVILRLTFIIWILPTVNLPSPFIIRALCLPPFVGNNRSSPYSSTPRFKVQPSSHHPSFCHAHMQSLPGRPGRSSSTSTVVGYFSKLGSDGVSVRPGSFSAAGPPPPSTYPS